MIKSRLKNRWIDPSVSSWPHFRPSSIIGSLGNGFRRRSRSLTPNSGVPTLIYENQRFYENNTSHDDGHLGGDRPSLSIFICLLSTSLLFPP